MVAQLIAPRQRPEHPPSRRSGLVARVLPQLGAAFVAAIAYVDPGNSAPPAMFVAKLPGST